MSTTRLTRQQAQKIRDTHERLFPGLAAKCKMSLAQQQHMIDGYRRDCDRAADILGYRPQYEIK